MVRELVVSWIRGQWRWLYLHSEKSHGGQKGKMSLAGRPWNRRPVEQLMVPLVDRPCLGFVDIKLRVIPDNPRPLPTCHSRCRLRRPSHTRWLDVSAQVLLGRIRSSIV